VTRRTKPHQAPNKRCATSSRDATHATITPGLESYIQRVVDAAPPLSTGQKARLAVLLNRDGTTPRGDEAPGTPGNRGEVR
jgi:hypothetical protein